MKVRFSLLLALALVASSASAAEMTFSGTAKIKPTLFANFDFDSSLNDAPANHLVCSKPGGFLAQIAHRSALGGNKAAQCVQQSAFA